MNWVTGLEGEMLAGIWGPVLAAALASAESAWSPEQLHLPIQVRYTFQNGMHELPYATV
jgi:hypothetical protein